VITRDITRYADNPTIVNPLELQTSTFCMLATPKMSGSCMHKEFYYNEVRLYCMASMAHSYYSESKAAFSFWLRFYFSHLFPLLPYES